jgi:hypothetical protein
MWQAGRDSWGDYMHTYMAAIRAKYYSSEPERALSRWGLRTAGKVMPGGIERPALAVQREEKACVAV